MSLNIRIAHIIAYYCNKTFSLICGFAVNLYLYVDGGSEKKINP